MVEADHIQFSDLFSTWGQTDTVGGAWYCFQSVAIQALRQSAQEWSIIHLNFDRKVQAFSPKHYLTPKPCQPFPMT